MTYKELLKDYNALPSEYKQEEESYISFLKTKLVVNKKKAKEPVKRVLGKGKNVIAWIAPDFDAPIDDMKDYV